MKWIFSKQKATELYTAMTDAGQNACLVTRANGMPRVRCYITKTHSIAVRVSDNLDGWTASWQKMYVPLAARKFDGLSVATIVEFVKTTLKLGQIPDLVVPPEIGFTATGCDAVITHSIIASTYASHNLRCSYLPYFESVHRGAGTNVPALSQIALHVRELTTIANATTMRIYHSIRQLAPSLYHSLPQLVAPFWASAPSPATASAAAAAPVKR